MQYYRPEPCVLELSCKLTRSHGSDTRIRSECRCVASFADAGVPVSLTVDYSAISPYSKRIGPEPELHGLPGSGRRFLPSMRRTSIFPALASKKLVASTVTMAEAAQVEDSPNRLASALEPVLDGIWARSRAAEWAIPREDFAKILLAVAAKYLPKGSPSGDTVAFFEALRLEELALARGCAAGHERAWEVFLTRYREKLFEMALGIAREAATARELADSLYADLYGVNLRAGERVSKLASYTGRGSLEGWLRTVMAQEFVNRYRKTRRTTSLDEEVEQGRQFAVDAPDPIENAAPNDARVEQATNVALASLTAEDRFVLASYYLDGRTLAEIARTLGVHESTVSRRVDKLAKNLKKQILSGLGRSGMSRRQAEEALDTDVRDLRVDVRTSLAQDSAVATFSPIESPVGGTVRKAETEK